MADRTPEQINAARAEQLMREMQPHFAALKARLIVRFGKTHVSESLMRNEIWREYKTVEALEHSIRRDIETGRFAMLEDEHF